MDNLQEINNKILENRIENIFQFYAQHYEGLSLDILNKFETKFVMAIELIRDMQARIEELDIHANISVNFSNQSIRESADLKIRNSELEEENKKLREAQEWQLIESAPEEGFIWGY